MKTKPPPFFLPPPQSYWLKPYLGCFLISAIAFYLTKFVASLDSETADFSGLLGIILGAIAPNSFSWEILLVEGLMTIITVTLIIVLFTLSLSTSLFELIFALLSIAILAMIMTIIAQWIIKYWIYPFWGKIYGTLGSAIAITTSIILQYLGDRSSI